MINNQKRKNKKLVKQIIFIILIIVLIVILFFLFNHIYNQLRKKKEFENEILSFSEKNEETEQIVRVEKGEYICIFHAEE